MFSNWMVPYCLKQRLRSEWSKEEREREISLPDLGRNQGPVEPGIQNAITCTAFVLRQRCLR